MPEAFLVPSAQSAPGLVSQPTSCHLDGDRPNVPTSRFADPLFSTPISALIGCGGEASGRAHFLRIPKLTPTEEFVHIHTRPVRSDRPETQQLPHFLDRLTTIVFDRPLGSRSNSTIFPRRNCACSHSRWTLARNPTGSGVPSHNWIPSSHAPRSRTFGNQQPRALDAGLLRRVLLQGLLVVIDGSKGLRRGVQEVFGETTAV